MDELAICTLFDFRPDDKGEDLVTHSPALRRSRQPLLSKLLQGGMPFEFGITTPVVYLRHMFDLCGFFLSNDSMIPAFNRPKRVANIVRH